MCAAQSEVGDCGIIRGRELWRGVAEEGEVDGKKTVECLRGRLLAERAASRAAREEAELLSRRLSELERKLAIEIKARDRAEKMLRRIAEKLGMTQSFPVSRQSISSEASSGSSSVNCSHKTSLPAPSPHIDAENKEKEKPAQSPWEHTGDGASSDSTSEPGSTSRSNDLEESWGSFGTSSPSTLEENLQLEACSDRRNCKGEITEETNREDAASFPDAEARRFPSLPTIRPALSFEASFKPAGAMAR